MNISDAINRDPRPLGFLVMTLIADCYTKEGLAFFKDLLDRDISNATMNNIMMTTKVNVRCDAAVDRQVLVLNCTFLGHAGYPGGLSEKEICCVNMIVEPDALNYMLAVKHEAILDAEKDYIKNLDQDHE